MESAPPWLPDWQAGDAYAALVRAEPAAIAWEWLRRDPRYRAAVAAPHRQPGTVPAVVAAQPAAARWGLHAFAEPGLAAEAARPVWRAEWLPRVLIAEAAHVAAARDRFDLTRFAGIAVVVCDDAGSERVLLSDGAASLRVDIVTGSVLAGPVCLVYRLAGLAAVRAPLDTLQGLLRLCRSGRLHRPALRSRNRRLILLLRAHDALQAGASQREIAEVLLSGEAARARWRTEVPSLRLRAQRLAKGAQAMADGGYRSLLWA
jgi:hypothetical protein